MLTDEQKLVRLDYITGSDASIICGISKYCTPYRLWEYKTGRAVPEDISNKPAVKAGNMLEGAVREWLSEAINDSIAQNGTFHVSEKYPFMAATIDGRTWRDDAIVEIKTSSSDTGWGDTGSTDIPHHYLLQVQHYMAVLDVERCHVAVLIRGVDFRHYCIERDDELISYLIAREKEFYDCMVNDTPPAFMDDQDLVASLNRVALTESVEATNDIEHLFISLKLIREQMKACEETEEELKLQLCKFMGAAQVLVSKSGHVLATWKKPKDALRLSSTLVQSKYPEVYKECLKTSESSRRFLVK